MFVVIMSVPDARYLLELAHSMGMVGPGTVAPARACVCVCARVCMFPCVCACA